MLSRRRAMAATNDAPANGTPAGYVPRASQFWGLAKILGLAAKAGLHRQASLANQAGPMLGPNAVSIVVIVSVSLWLLPGRRADPAEEESPAGPSSKLTSHGDTRDYYKQEAQQQQNQKRPRDLDREQGDKLRGGDEEEDSDDNSDNKSTSQADEPPLRGRTHSPQVNKSDQPEDHKEPEPDIEQQVHYDESHDDQDEDDELYVVNQTSPARQQPIGPSGAAISEVRPEFDDFDDHSALRAGEFWSSDEADEATAPASSERGQQSNLSSTSGQQGYLASGSSGYGRLSGPGWPPANQCALMLSRPGSCVTWEEVEWAAREARRLLAIHSPPSDLNSIEISDRSVHKLGELNELTTRLLATRHGLGPQEVAFELEQIDLRRSSLWRWCPLIYRWPPPCRARLARFRTHTGLCNNPVAPLVGASNTPFVRLLPADYADGVGQPRRGGLASSELPPARLVALNLHPDVDNPSDSHSALFASWGQLMNHDLAMAAGAGPFNAPTGACCSGRARGPLARLCMPIALSRDDPMYARFGLACHEFKRSLNALRPGCSLGPRAQLNQVTAFVDVSFVYGSFRSTSRTLRASSGRQRGMLRMWNYFGNAAKPLLPPQLNEPDFECVGRPAGRHCFRSGDARTNQQVPLTVLHTLHTRQHNRLASALGQLNPHWSPNRVYHEARHIHVALVQHFLLAEYLPALLGPQLCLSHNLTESEPGQYWDHYDPSLNAGVSHAFAAAAFRQGHSTVPSQVYRVSPVNHEATRVYPLRQLFRQPWPLFEPGALDEFLLGLVDAPAQSFDPFVSGELSGQLLKLPRAPFGLDLIAINIQRGRDQGVASYTAFRNWCGLEMIASFEDLTRVMRNESAHLMASLYNTVDDIDLFAGGLSEFNLEGAQVGPTFACIIGRQFSALRAGDRFWFESSAGPHAFTPDQLDSIKQASLARLLCANSDNVVTIQPSVLQLPHPILNPRVFCNALPDLDITLWLEPRPVPNRPATAAENPINEDDDDDDDVDFDFDSD